MELKLKSIFFFPLLFLNTSDVGIIAEHRRYKRFILNVFTIEGGRALGRNFTLRRVQKCKYNVLEYTRGLFFIILTLMYQWCCALGYGNPPKMARSNQQKHTFTIGSVATFLLIAAGHLGRVSVAHGTL